MRYNINMAARLALVTVFVGSPLFSQVPKTAAKPSFEVASVKRNTSGANFGGIGFQTDRFTANNTTLTTLVQTAYHLPQDQKLRLFGMPDWMDSERFDIEAKPEGEPRSVTVDEMRLMVQSLLEERFQLKVHRESQEVSVYTLAVGNGEPKFKPSSDPAQAIPVPSALFGEPRTVQSPFGPIGGGLTSPPMPRGGLIMAVGSDLVGTAVDMSHLASFLAQQVDRPVIDKTGLKGPFDFKLHYTVDPRAYFSPGGQTGPNVTPPTASDPAGSSIFTAVQEIGLKLESSKSPVEVLVIDSVRKPTAN